MPDTKKYCKIEKKKLFRNKKALLKGKISLKDNNKKNNRTILKNKKTKYIKKVVAERIFSLCPLFSLPSNCFSKSAYSIRPPIFLGRSLDLLVVPWSAQMQIWLYSSLYLLPKSTTAPKVRESQANCKEVTCYTCSLAHLYSVWLLGERGVWQTQLGYIQQQRSVGSCHSLRQVMCSPQGSGPGSFHSSTEPSYIGSQEFVGRACACSQLGGSCDF